LAFPYTRLVQKNYSIPSCLILAAVLFSVMAPPPAHAAKKWREYTDCQVIPNKANDGDSFHVKPGNRKTTKYLFRLYFVDTPESEKSLPERLQVQADYWGITDPKLVVKAGKDATQFTEEFLKDGFTVHSRLSDALGRSKKDRDYAMVIVDGKDLGTELVRNGLARVFGRGTNLSELDGYNRTESSWWKRLRGAEMEAKKAKRGAWAYSGAPVSRMDALFAPRQIEEQDVVLTRSIYMYPLDPPNSQRPMGQLKAGLTVHVIEGVSPTRAHVRFTSSAGQVYEGLAQFSDLGL
jgi:endonuclease YncB( thermonuclease family)